MGKQRCTLQSTSSGQTWKMENLDSSTVLGYTASSLRLKGAEQDLNRLNYITSVDMRRACDQRLIINQLGLLVMMKLVLPCVFTSTF